MKRVRRAGISRGKKIAGLVILCLVVALGYFGYHRLTAHADQYVTKGVINNIEDLPQNPDAEVGTEQHPFLILEVVAYSGEAEFGYLIDGCEPIDFSQKKNLLYNNQFSLGSVLTQAFIDEYERESDSFVASSWKKNKQGSWSVTGYYEKVTPGQGNFTYDGTNTFDGTEYRPNFTKVAQGQGDFIWVSLGSDITTFKVQENKQNTSDVPIEFVLGDREYTTRTDTGYYYYDSSAGYYPGLTERFIDEFERDKDSYDDNTYAWEKDTEKECELQGYYEYVGANQGNFVYDGNREDGAFPISRPLVEGTVYRPNFSKVEDGQGDFIWVTTGMTPTTDQYMSGPYSANSMGYYERVADGTGDYNYIGNYEMPNPLNTYISGYFPSFEKAENGNGDFVWVTENTWYFDPSPFAVKEEGDRVDLSSIGTKYWTYSEADPDINFTSQFSEGVKVYTTRRDTGVYVRQVKNPDEATDRYYVHHNQFLRTALHLRTREEVANYHIVIKSIEPWELSADTRWIDYADLIYIHQGGQSVGAAKDYWENSSYWMDSKGGSLKRVEDTNNLAGKTINGSYVANPSQSKKIGDNFSSADDLSWEAAKKLFLKVNALEDYADNGQFRFAPLMMQGTLLNSMNSMFAATQKTVTHYPLDYTTLEAVKTTDIRGYGDEDLGSRESANRSNLYKFLLMNFMMNQDNFYKFFFKNPRATTGTCVIQEQGAIGLHSSQDSGDPQEYWSVRAFLPNPDTNTLQWSGELLEHYGIVHDGGAFMNYSGNVALNGGSFIYNSDNSVSQMFNNSAIRKNDRLDSAFDWQGEENGWNSNSMSPVQMLEYLLNYRKKGSSDENERDRNKIKIQILEIEPCNDFIWNNETVLNAFFPPSRFEDPEVECMTTQEFNGAKMDLASDYDIVYIGMTTGKFNMKEDAALPEWDEESDFVNYNDAMFNANQNYLLAGKIYLHVGDLIKDASNKKLRVSGNDISTIKQQELELFSKSGILILDDTLQSYKSRQYTRQVDSASNMNSLIIQVYDKNTNVAAYGTLKNQFTKLVEMMKDTKVAYKSQMEIVSTPPEYAASDGSNQSLDSSVLNYTFKINQLDSDEFKKKYGINVPDTVNKKKFGIKLYMDLDYDGLITDNGETSEIVYDSQTDASTYEMPAKYEASTETYEFSLDFAKILEERKMEARKNGAVTWRFVIYDIDDEDYYISQTGTSYYHGSNQKRSIRFYQIVADNEALNSNANLMKQYLQGNSLFHKYTSDLADYEINSNSETVTLAEYIQKYQTEIDNVQDELEKLLAFQDVDMIIVSCAQKMQTEAANHPDAINFIKTLADSGISVLYTTEAASRDKVLDAELVSNNMKNMMNQSRFTDYSVYYQDNTGYSQGKTTTDGQLANTDTYELSDYKSLEYTYKAAMQAGSDDKNSLMCFRDSLWEENNISYGLSNNAAKTNKITEVNTGKLTTYPYNINDAEVNTSGTVAQDFQLNMNNPYMTVWYCLGGEDNSLYGISPNDATNNYYLYTVGNVAYTSADLEAVTDDEEMKLFVNTLIANYDVSALYPRVVVNAVKGIRSVDKDGVVADSSQFANTNSTLYFDALMSQLQSAYSDYAENAANTTPIPVVTEEPDATLEPTETLPPDPEEDSSGGVSGSIQQPAATPSVNENDSSIVHNPDKVKKVADTDDGSYIPTGKDYTHKIYFTPFDSNAPGGNIHSLRISLVDKAANGGADAVYQYIGTIYHQDLVTGHVFEYTASSADYTFTVTKGNFTQDSQEYFFLYKEKYMLTKFDYVKFEIANDKRTGITYLHPYNEVKADNTYVFPLD